MLEQTNSIKRLLRVLERVIDFGDANVSPASSASIAWTGALEMSDPESLNNLLCDLIADVGECERTAARDTRINESLYLKHIAKVKRGLLSVNSGTWEGFRKTFDGGLLDALQLMSEIISAYRGEEVISVEDLATLQSNVEDIINRVVASDLEDDIKRVLFDGLESVRNALLNYQMFGAEGIRQSLDKNFALPFRYSDEFIRASGSDEGKNIVSAFFEFLKRLNVVASTGLKIKQISGPAIDRMLESGG